MERSAVIDSEESGSLIFEKAARVEDAKNQNTFLETHFHADFVSDIWIYSAKDWVQSRLVYGPNNHEKWFFDAIVAKDGPGFKLERLK